jgi:uncharacterized protein
MTQQNYTPGVRIQHVLTEPRRVLHTGVPVFLGLIRLEHLRAHNARYPQTPDERYIRKPIPAYPAVSIVRKRGYLQLPDRPVNDRHLPDSMSRTVRTYIRSIPSSETPAVEPEQAPYAGSAGRVNQSQPEQTPLELFKMLSDKPQRFTLWPQFEATYGDLKPFGFLVNAVRGFFENDGRLCYVQLISFDEDEWQQALEAGLKLLEITSDFDLVCVPDLLFPDLSSKPVEPHEITYAQQQVIQHCEAMGNRFAILDALSSDADAVPSEQRNHLLGHNAALYYPWLLVHNGPEVTAGFMPPCGHVAGIIAQTDRRVGVYKAPANEVLHGVLDLQVKLSDEEQSPLNEQGVNCMRAFPRRGIRVWGARTLSIDPNWRYINVRRIFTTAARWLEQNMMDVVFEPNTPELWAQITRDLSFYFADLLQQGALAGRSAGEAFYVKCDAETNPPETREAGQVIAEIGLAVDLPAEFIVVRIMHGITGVRIIGPN